MNSNNLQPKQLQVEQYNTIQYNTIQCSFVQVCNLGSIKLQIAPFKIKQIKFRLLYIGKNQFDIMWAALKTIM